MHQTKHPVMMNIFQLNRVKKHIHVSDETELAENFNDYFVNIASKLTEPIEHNDFSILREHINSKIPKNMHFELPDIDEHFIFKSLSTLDVSNSFGLDGIGPRLLKLASRAFTKGITYEGQSKSPWTLLITLASFECF